MNGNTYRCVLCYRLGVPLFFVVKPCSTCSKVFVGNIYKNHRVSCTGIIAGKEVDIGLDRGRNKPLRLADMLLYSWDGGLDVCVDLTGSSPVTQTGMADFMPGRVVIYAAHRKRVKYETKCFAIGYGFLPFLFSSLWELEKSVITLLKRIQKFSMNQNIRACASVHICNKIDFAIAKGVGAQIVSRLPINFVFAFLRCRYWKPPLLLPGYSVADASIENATDAAGFFLTIVDFISAAIHLRLSLLSMLLSSQMYLRPPPKLTAEKSVVAPEICCRLRKHHCGAQKAVTTAAEHLVLLDELVMKRVTKIIVLMDTITRINDHHYEFMLLRTCASIYKLYFAMRTCPPWVFEMAQRSFDAALRFALECIITASRPSLLACRLNCFDILTMNGKTYRCVLCYRLGVLLFFVLKPCSACSKVFSEDIYGDHVVSYVGIIGIKHRHNVVRDTLVDICFRSGILAEKEVDIGLGGGCDKPLRPTRMVDFVPGRAKIDATHRKRVKEGRDDPTEADLKVLCTQDIGAHRIKSFPRGTSCGRDGLRAQHLMDCLSGAVDVVSNELVSSITQVGNLFLDGKCPNMLGEYIVSAPLTPLVKSGGGIRLIAVGTIWRRLVSKVSNVMIAHSLDGYLDDLQFRLGCREVVRLYFMS
nr:hypothetical protein [Tanacetum cinerariifolium]